MKLEELHELLTEGVAKITTGDDWRALLDVMARFHGYSAKNTALIYLQRPTATHVAGYTTWRKMGRQVNKGERGISILAPCIYKDTEDEDTRVLRGYRVVSVFDISQTTGDELPGPRPALLTGDAPSGLWDALAEQVRASGFDLERGTTHPANGVTNYTTKTVTISDTLEPAQAAKTLAHELAHVLLHDGAEPHRGRIEVEAESVAHVVCTVAGIETSDYSWPYVAGWSGGDLDLIRSTMTTVTETAREILDTIAPDPDVVEP